MSMEDGKNADFGSSYYQQISDAEILSKFRPLLATGGYKVREDGKIYITEPSIAWDTPWHHVVHDHFLDCQRWHSIIYELFSNTMPPGQSFVPSACQQCWKVVVRPKTLLSLFALLELQNRLGLSSKCGIEIRPYVYGNYGGYFYNHSFEEGLACYSKVRKEVDETEHLGKDVSVILKRACTEYENKLGRSDEWTISDRQIYIETLVNRWYVKDTFVRKQSEHAIAAVHKKWIEFAYSIGDGTYLNFTGGEPLYKPLVTYHHLVEPGNEELLSKNKEKFKRQYNFGYDL